MRGSVKRMAVVVGALMTATLAGAWFAPAGVRVAPRSPQPEPPSAKQVDEGLQRAAERALGGRSGAVLVMDARTGRLRAAVGSRLAFEEAFAPGSAVKPFTLLAAMRAGVVNEASSASCSGSYEHEGVRFNCTHPRFKTPLRTSSALAHSCNLFHARAGESAGGEKLIDTLSEFGFGSATGGADASGLREQSGALPRGRAGVAEAIGESERLGVTPVQLLAAYAALFNGGRLLAPQREDEANFRERLRAQLRIEDDHRALLVEGMRGAVVEGTAARARLNDLPVFVFGKTGTATERGGFRPQGWFVGLAAEKRDDESASDRLAPPEKVGLAVLVFLRRGRGSDAAEVSRPIFEEYARTHAPRGEGDANRTNRTTKRALTSGDDDVSLDDVVDERAAFDDGAAIDNEASASDSARGSASHVRVRLSRARVTLSLNIEDYVFGVLAAESSIETEPEALKTMAVAARTYAAKNMRRHAAHGYDLCDSTHCQRFIAVGDESARPDFYESVRRAVLETAGETLRDSAGRVAETYFSASCGGATADISTLWGVRNPARHLRGSRDESCDGVREDWTDVISSSDLLRALRADERSDVGARLDHLRVVRRDGSGRVELIALEGERRRLLRGWDFKIIVGRTLGWNVLKSSRFDLMRAGGNYVFRGRGFGHGLGVCQAGAHTQAARGATYRQILRRYLPGTHVSRAGEESSDAFPVIEQRALRNVLQGRTPALAEGLITGSLPTSQRGASQRTRLTLTSEHFRLSYPASTPRAEAEAFMRALSSARGDVMRRLAAASFDGARIGRTEVVLHETTGDFVGATGEPAWAAGVTLGRRIELQPLAALRRRGVLTTTIKHEMVHVACEALRRGGRPPLWLLEGMAAHIAGEGALLARHAPRRKMNVEEIERGLTSSASADETRALYAAAHAEVAALIRREGEAAVWRRLLANSKW